MADIYIIDSGRFIHIIYFGNLEIWGFGLDYCIKKSVYFCSDFNNYGLDCGRRDLVIQETPETNGLHYEERDYKNEPNKQ